MSQEPAAIRVHEVDRPRLAAPGTIVQLPRRGVAGLSVAWLRTHETVVLGGILLVVYLALYGSLLVSSNGLPFIMDNNESFSSMWHGRHLAVENGRQTAWLADEVFSPHPEAHPYVHTHQGNFPRLFVMVLYLAGARSVESQTLVTMLSVGVLAVFFLYRFFERVAGPRFAFLCGIVFLTDYLLFAQWHLVTYRVWHGFFLFGALLCVRGLAETDRPLRWLIPTYLLFVALFYYELVFVAFVSIFAGLYAAWTMRRLWRRVLAYGTAQVLGGATALSVLVAQLAVYLGWDGLREDLSVTYLARNFAVDVPRLPFSPHSIHEYFAFIGRLSGGNPEAQQRLQDFYDLHRVVFWWNFVDSKQLLQPAYFLGTLFVFVFQVYTPLLVLLVAMVLAGWMLGLGLRLSSERLARRQPTDGRLGFRAALRASAARARVVVQVRVDPVSPAAWEARLLRAGAVGLRFVPLAAASLFLLITLFRDHAYLGLPPTSASFTQANGRSASLMLAMVALSVPLVISRLVTGRWLACAQLPLVRTGIATLVLWGVGYAIRAHGARYDQVYAPVWYGLIEAQLPPLVTRAAVIAAVALMLAFVYGGDRRVLGRQRAGQLPALAPYLLSGTVAYGAIYLLAAGYVLTGYLVRYEPPVVFVTDPIMALTLMAVWSVGAAPLRQVREAWTGCQNWLASARVRQPRWQDTPGQTAFFGAAGEGLAGVSVSAVLVLVLAGYWLQVQTVYLRELPPTHFEFLQELREAPYRGATFVVNSYAAPVAWQVQEWAYFDPLLGKDEIVIDEERREIRVLRDMNTYLWLADKATNPDYATPDYFVCMTPRSMRGVLEQITQPPTAVGRCTDLPIVRNAMNGKDRPYLRHQLAARDESRRDSWAIVRMDWQIPEGWQLVSDTVTSRALYLKARVQPDEAAVSDSARTIAVPGSSAAPSHGQPRP